MGELSCREIDQPGSKRGFQGLQPGRPRLVDVSVRYLAHADFILGDLRVKEIAGGLLGASRHRLGPYTPGAQVKELEDGPTSPYCGKLPCRSSWSYCPDIGSISA